MSKLRILVTGGAGFIGSNLARSLLGREEQVERVVVLDKLTYAGSLENLSGLENDPRFRFVQGDILDRELVRGLLIEESVNRVMHLAAESHVDRSIVSADYFVQTNVIGTQRILETSLERWEENLGFRFLHVSTDEVYGSLKAGEAPFTESSPYAPNSPYAASKAGGDHLVRAWHRTYGLPVVLTHCSNNLGPRQHREKLIPRLIHRLLSGQALPIFGDGLNVRDWIWVGDHCEALFRAMEQGVIGESYLIGANAERTNLQIAQGIVETVQALRPELIHGPLDSLIDFVEDRPGHDWRYAVDSTKLRKQTGWEPRVSFEEALERTVRWYLQSSREA